MTGGHIIRELGGLICKVERHHPVRIAIDGVDAAGKTTLADELALVLEETGRPVVRASVDGFHNPRAIRCQQGVDSPEGYYRDSFNHAAILKDLLIPLGPGGDRKIRRVIFDYRLDSPIDNSPLEAPANSILLFDGVFLLRPELRDCWDFSIFVDVDFDVSVPRAVERDLVNSKAESDRKALLAKYNQRYVPGQKIYFAEAKPQRRADVIVVNNDFQNPRLVVK